MHWMEGLTDEWLMIFDNCTLRDRRAFLPGGNTGSILYTSRLTSLVHDFPSHCTLEVTPLSLTDAVNLFLKVSALEGISESSSDWERIQNIVRELGCLPLDICNSGAAIRGSHIPLEVFLRQLLRAKVCMLLVHACVAQSNMFQSA